MQERRATVHALRDWAIVRHLCIVHVAFISLTAHAQSGAGSTDGRVEILNADEWSYDQTASGAQRLRGNVRFKHADALMRCDSAYLFEDQRVDAFGHVAIDQGDSMHVEADRLKYNGQERLARLEGNVRLRDRSMELTTPSLDYDLRARRAVYTAGGRIVSQREGNTLTSDAGSYLADQRRFIFKRNVRLQNPQHSIASDTMHYITSTGVSEFFGPTTITQGSTVIQSLRGSYDTRTERARFTQRTSIDSKGRRLEGDSIHYERSTGIGLAWGHVVVTDSTGDTRAMGEVGSYEKLSERSMITGHAELAMRMGADTLHLHGDTLFTAPDSSGRRITARRGVRFFKQDLQGVCDTLVYSDADSTIRMHHRPALWSGTDQITGQHIRIELRNGAAYRLYVEREAFLLSQVDSIHLDQVTGTMMTGYFHDNELRRLDVEGNARTVYFAKEKKGDVEEIFGVNRADCSRMRVDMTDGGISAVNFLERPDAVLYPIAKAPPEELLMKGAESREGERPVDQADIFRH
jgi:lipopolysaccharide export system protein LptA